MTTTAHLLAPLLSLSLFAFILFGLDASSGWSIARFRTTGFWLTLLGLAVTAALIPDGLSAPVLFGRRILVWDGLTFFISWISVLTIMIVVLLSEHYRAFDGLRLNAYFGLLLLSATGLIFAAASNDFLMIFLAIELVGIPGFILAGYLRHQERSSEAAIKFFLIGAFSSAMLAYGISILYGITGTTSLSLMHNQLSVLQAHASLTLLAVFFILVSFGFKIALVPFHMWVPDVFEGAPLPIAAYLSVAPKIAGVAIALRVLDLNLSRAHPEILGVLAGLAAVTMTIANIIGLQQRNVVRLLAYSSIAHMGYLLLGLVAGSVFGVGSAYLYAWVYLFMNLGAFAVVISISNALGSNDLSAYAGLSKRSPLISALLVLFLISLAGIPPTAGFVAKFYVFSAAFQSGWVWLVILAGVNSVISVGYYFKILRAMYFQSPVSESPIDLTLSTRLTLAVTSFFTLMLGIAPQYYMNRVAALAGPTATQMIPADAPVTATVESIGAPGTSVTEVPR